MRAEYRYQSTWAVDLREEGQAAFACLLLAIEHGRVLPSDLPTGKQRVAKTEALQVHARFEQMMVTQFASKFGGEVCRLVAPDFLKGDNIGIKIGQGRRDGRPPTLPRPEPPPNIPC